MRIISSRKWAKEGGLEKGNEAGKKKKVCSSLAVGLLVSSYITFLLVLGACW